MFFSLELGIENTRDVRAHREHRDLSFLKCPLQAATGPLLNLNILHHGNLGKLPGNYVVT